MISPALGRNAQKALRHKCCAKPTQCRGLASAASGTLSYEINTSAGVKIASRNIAGPTTHLALVALAGTRFQSLPGLTEALEKFAFKSTNKRSSLRITREAELLGAQLIASHSRESLLIGAKFLRGDLPYILELLAEVISQTKYTRHEFQEEVAPIIKISHKALLADVGALASNSAHGVAFHRGLGNPLHPTSSNPLTTYLNNESIHAFSRKAYAKPNFAVVANGASHEEVSRWVHEFFGDLENGTPLVNLQFTKKEPIKYYGGEERIAHGSGNAMIIAFPGSGSFPGSAYRPEILVLAALLGGESSIKWSPGFSLLAQATVDFPQAHVKTFNSTYSGGGLLQISISGNAKDVKLVTYRVTKVLRSVASGNFSEEDFKRAVAAAKFNVLHVGYNIKEFTELIGVDLVAGEKAYQVDEIAKSIQNVTQDQLQKTVKSFLAGKATVSAVGDLFVLPFAEDIELKV